MDIYTDYANWKVENYELLQQLTLGDGIIFQRQIPCYLVLEYFYDIIVNKKRNLTSDEEYIFNTGFEYLYDRLDIIKNILIRDFNNDFLSLNKINKTLNLLLYVEEFIDEFSGKISNVEIKKIIDFQNEVDDLIIKKENPSDALFLKFSDMIDEIMTKNELEIKPVEEIYFDIALDYDLLETNEEDIFNDFINEKIKHEHHH